MNRCSFCEWIPILPWPLWPLAGQFSLGQNVVVGSMTLLLAVRGKHCHEKYVWTPVCFTTAPYHGLVWSYRAELSYELQAFVPDVSRALSLRETTPNVSSRAGFGGPHAQLRCRRGGPGPAAHLVCP